MSFNPSTKGTTANWSQVFFGKSSEFNQILLKHDIKAPLAPASCLEDFSKLPTETQKALCERIEFFIEMASDASRENLSLLEDRRLAWLVIRKLKLRPPNDLFSFVADGDHIEIYDPTGLQIFRNFDFMRLTTYSLQEILMYSFLDLYARQQEVSDLLFQEFGKAFQSQVPFLPAVPKHRVWEAKGAGVKLEFEVAMKVFSPLFNSNGDVAAMFAASKITRA